MYTDNMVNQKVLLRQLTMAGYLCDVASNGLEAVEKNEPGSYDLIFMDVVRHYWCLPLSFLLTFVLFLSALPPPPS